MKHRSVDLLILTASCCDRSLLFNPISELQQLRQTTLFKQTGVTVNSGALYSLGSAVSMQFELKVVFALPSNWDVSCVNHCECAFAAHVVTLQSNASFGAVVRLSEDHSTGTFIEVRKIATTAPQTNTDMPVRLHIVPNTHINCLCG